MNRPGPLGEPTVTDRVDTGSLRTVADVARVCEAHGLQRLTGADDHPRAWLCPDRVLGVAISGVFDSMTGVHVQRVLDFEAGETEQIATVQPRVNGAARLLAVVLHEASATKRSPVAPGDLDDEETKQ